MRPAPLLLMLAIAAGAPRVRAQAAPTPLSPGDRVFVRVGSDTTRSDSLVVDAEGRIFLPRIGPLDLRAVSASNVPAAVREALTRFYRTSDATVVPLRRVTVTGEVRKAGVFFLPLEASLRDALATAQGVTEIGDIERVTLVRGGVEIRLRKWVTKPEGAQPIVSGDLLVVERDSWIRRNALAAISTLGIVFTTIIAVTR